MPIAVNAFLLVVQNVQKGFIIYVENKQKRKKVTICCCKNQENVLKYVTEKYLIFRDAAPFSRASGRMWIRCS